MRHLSSEINSGMDGKTVKIGGFAQYIRVLGKLAFIKLRDRDGVVQVTISSESPDFEKVKSLTPESAIGVIGKVRASDKASNGFEIVPEKISVESLAEVPLPIDFSGKINTDLSKRLDYRWMDLRNPKTQLIFRVMNTFEDSMRRHFRDSGLMEIHSARLMDSPSETSAELFEVNYFKRKAYLSQSPQFYKQMGVISGFDRVYEIAPMFRADQSHTTRHLTEFISIDAELAWADHSEVMAFLEKGVAESAKCIKEAHGPAIMEHFKIGVEAPRLPFPRISMRDAVGKAKGLEIGDADDFYELDSEGEKALGDYILKAHKHDFVFLTDFPIGIRPFYHMRHDENQRITKSFDLIYKGQEIATGSQREHRHGVLVGQAKEKGLNPEGLRHYLDFFRYGAPPHSGFGFGPSRFVAQLLNLGNVREATLLPRDIDRLTP